jgi:hypothetical protein
LQTLSGYAAVCEKRTLGRRAMSALGAALAANQPKTEIRSTSSWLGTSRGYTKRRGSSRSSTSVLGWKPLRGCRWIRYHKKHGFLKQLLASQLHRLAPEKFRKGLGPLKCERGAACESMMGYFCAFELRCFRELCTYVLRRTLPTSTRLAESEPGTTSRSITAQGSPQLKRTTSLLLETRGAQY